jgi:trimethylamine---corrinoid protein Co-methyltransferase
MENGYDPKARPSYRLLTEEQIVALHDATIELLETVGMRVSNDEAVEMCRAAGCEVKDGGPHGRMVLFPRRLVDAAIASAPKSISVYDRKGREAMRLEGRNNYYGLGTDLIHTYDLKTGDMHSTVLQDVINAAIITDAMPEIDFVASFGLPHDVPTNTMYIECVRAMLQNTVKPVFTTAGGHEDLSVIIAMAEEVAGGAEALAAKPTLIHYSEPTPPLVHSYGAVRKLFLCADKGVPICYVPGGILGGTSPVTLAGGIVQQNAEMLSGLVLHQLRKPGSPIITGFACVAMDMRTSVFTYAAPEFRLTHSAYADLYHYYGLPMWGTVGSEAMVFDQQAGMDHAFTTLMAAMDGTNLIHDVGYLGQGLIANPAMLVMCNEIIAWVKRFQRGFDITRETMAVDVIGKVGPGGGYLQEDHTYKHWKNELWHPKLANRDNPDGWKTKGCKTYGEVCAQKALSVLATHKPAPLPEATVARLAEIVAEAEKNLAGLHFKA